MIGGWKPLITKQSENHAFRFARSGNARMAFFRPSLAGWQLARWYGFDARHRLTLSIEIGMQNAGLGVALALAHFPPEAALPGALFAVWSVITATGAGAWLRRRGRGGGVAGPLAAD